jgi:transcription termination factor Rho
LETISHIYLSDLKKKNIKELHEFAKQEAILEEHTPLDEQGLLSCIVKNYLKNNQEVVAEGVADVLQEGYAFLRFADGNYLPGYFDVYMAPKIISKFNIRTGDTIICHIGLSQKSEKFFPLKEVISINGKKAHKGNVRRSFDKLTPIHPVRRINLEFSEDTDITSRVINIVAPIGFGQRGLIVAPPKTGKTTIMQKMARAIEVNHPDTKLIVLLIDERPEEVTDMKRRTKAEVIFSTFDESAAMHVKVAEMVIEKAKRLAEEGEDVIILFDSITRLARAYNAIIPSSGKVLSGGVDANALQKPKRFFGAARAIEEGGSLTIIATALVDTGSKMDEVIFEEFKSTGNMELVLDRRLEEKRQFPCVAVDRSGTRKEELLLSPEELSKCWILRKLVSSMGIIEGTEFLFDKMRKTKTNKDFFTLMSANLQ